MMLNFLKEPSDMTEVGKNIARLRKRENLTQEELANKLGVSPQAVSKWENEQSCPDITLLPKLAEIFNVTVDALLRDAGIADRQNESLPLTPEQTEKTDASSLPVRRIRIEVINNGKTTNITLPAGVIKFGLNLGSKFGVLEDEQMKTIADAVNDGLRGEILHIQEEEEEVRVILE